MLSLNRREPTVQSNLSKMFLFKALNINDSVKNAVTWIQNISIKRNLLKILEKRIFKILIILDIFSFFILYIGFRAIGQMVIFFKKAGRDLTKMNRKITFS